MKLPSIGLTGGLRTWFTRSHRLWLLYHQKLAAPLQARGAQENSARAHRAYDLAIQEPGLAKKAIGKYTRTTDRETRDATSKETRQSLRVAHPLCVAGRTHVDHRFSRGSNRKAKKLVLEKMFDNSLLQKSKRK